MSNEPTVVKAEVYLRKAQDIIKEFKGEDGKYNFNFPTKTINEAKMSIKRISLIKKNLMVVKRELGQEMTKIRSIYSDASGNVQAGALATFAGKGTAGRDRAAKKRGLKANRDKFLEPYEKVKNWIEKVILKMDNLKLICENNVNKMKS